MPPGSFSDSSPLEVIREYVHGHGVRANRLYEWRKRDRGGKLQTGKLGAVRLCCCLHSRSAHAVSFTPVLRKHE